MSYAADGVFADGFGPLVADPVEGDGYAAGGVWADGYGPGAGSEEPQEAQRLGGFVITDTPSKLWWKRKPRFMPDDEAQERLDAVAEELARVASKQVRKIQPGQPVAITKATKIEARDAVAPLVADMPGFDWVALYRRILDALQLQAMEQAAQQMAAQEIERIRLMELDEEDVLILLMGT